MRKKLIFFDAVGTLIYPTPPVHEVYQTAAIQFGSTLSVESINEKFWSAYKAHFPASTESNIQTNEKIEKQRWNNVIDDIFGVVSIDNPTLFTELWNHFSKPASWTVYDGVWQIMKELMQAGYHVGIASNFDARLKIICETHFPNVDENLVFYSTQLGYAKPDINFYKSIESHVNDSDIDYIMIGDDWSNDIEAAQNAGWDAVHRDNLATLFFNLGLE